MGLSYLKLQLQISLKCSEALTWQRQGSLSCHSLKQAFLVLVCCHLYCDSDIWAGPVVLRFQMLSVSQGIPVNIIRTREESSRQWLCQAVGATSRWQMSLLLKCIVRVESCSLHSLERAGEMLELSNVRATLMASVSRTTMKPCPCWAHLWSFGSVILNLPNAAIFQYSSSCCGEPQPYNHFCYYFLTVTLLLLWITT